MLYDIAYHIIKIASKADKQNNFLLSDKLSSLSIKIAQITEDISQPQENTDQSSIQENEQVLSQEFKTQVLNTVKPMIDALIPSPEAMQNEIDSAYRQIKKILSEANQKIDTFNREHPNFKIDYVKWQDFPELSAPTSGVMRYFLMPYTGKGKVETQDVLTNVDQNTNFILQHILSVFQKFNITDDEDGAKMLAELSSSDDFPEIRMIVNEYYGKTGRTNFQNLLRLAGFSNLATAFENIPDKVLNFTEYSKLSRPQPKIEKDVVYGEDYGLDTRSEAERQILSIFRDLDLQPLPVEIKMPSTKTKKDSKTINTEFMCDFLLPCEVLRGFNEDGSPIIESQVVFVGEYFGWFGSDYDSKTSMKEELEPFQAVLTGNDVIFISKNDFEAGANSLKLINQLEAKSIIFRGSKSKNIIDQWLQGNKEKSRTKTYKAIASRVTKLTPEQSIIRAAMLQLEFKFGELAEFYQKYSDENNPEYRQLVTSLFNQYRVLKSEADEINKQIRAKQYRSKVKADDYNWNTVIEKSKNSEEINLLMDSLREINLKIRDLYIQNEQIQKLKESHQDSLNNNSDYILRYNELNKLYNMVSNGEDPLPNENMSLGKKVALICNNALIGLGTSLTRQKLRSKEFKPILITAYKKFKNVVLGQYGRYINE